MRIRIVVPLVATLAAGLGEAEAQAPPPSPRAALVDRVVAVVGDTALLWSDLQAEVAERRARDAWPTDTAAQDSAWRALVNERVEDLLLVQAAKAAGIQVQDAELQPAVEDELRQIRGRFASEEEFRRALAQSGFTEESYRRHVLEQFRARALVQRYLNRELDKRPRPPIDEAELRRAFEAQRDALGPRPVTISFRQAIVEPTPSDTAVAGARQRALAALERLRRGEDFATVARQVSEDPGSRDAGGDLGWIRRGQLVPAFEAVAFNLPPGVTSGLVETEYGIHILRVERVRGPERQVRHILFRPTLTQQDIDRARARADSLARAVRAGAPLPNWASRLRDLPTVIDDAVLDRLPEDYRQALANARAGDVIGPLEVPGPLGPRFVVLQVRERNDSGAYRFEDVRDQLLQRLQEQRLTEALLEELRQRIPVRIFL